MTTSDDSQNRVGSPVVSLEPLMDVFEGGGVEGVAVGVEDVPVFPAVGGDVGVPVYDTRVGRIGVAICYDRHFPEVMRALAVHGAQLVVVPQAGAVDEWPEGLYEAEMRVAAFQNGYFTALCNRVLGTSLGGEMRANTAPRRAPSPSKTWP